MNQQEDGSVQEHQPQHLIPISKGSHDACAAKTSASRERSSSLSRSHTWAARSVNRDCLRYLQKKRFCGYGTPGYTIQLHLAIAAKSCLSRDHLGVWRCVTLTSNRCFNERQLMHNRCQLPWDRAVHSKRVGLGHQLVVLRHPPRRLPNFLERGVRAANFFGSNYNCPNARRRGSKSPRTSAAFTNEGSHSLLPTLSHPIDQREFEPLACLPIQSLISHNAHTFAPLAGMQSCPAMTNESRLLTRYMM